MKLLERFKINEWFAREKEYPCKMRIMIALHTLLPSYFKPHKEQCRFQPDFYVDVVDHKEIACTLLCKDPNEKNVTSSYLRLHLLAITTTKRSMSLASRVKVSRKSSPSS